MSSAQTSAPPRRSRLCRLCSRARSHSTSSTASTGSTSASRVRLTGPSKCSSPSTPPRAPTSSSTWRGGASSAALSNTSSGTSVSRRRASSPCVTASTPRLASKTFGATSTPRAWRWRTLIRTRRARSKSFRGTRPTPSSGKARLPRSRCKSTPSTPSCSPPLFRWRRKSARARRRTSSATFSTASARTTSSPKSSPGLRTVSRLRTWTRRRRRRTLKRHTWAGRIRMTAWITCPRRRGRRRQRRWARRSWRPAGAASSSARWLSSPTPRAAAAAWRACARAPR
mmetsp:Transcript_24580/g.80309  ORF Transcript_24580/g.80309 Transcript_24580/m.80309 type:complete len:284 (-) Transcript_24580:219-1070(-)